MSKLHLLSIISQKGHFFAYEKFCGGYVYVKVKDLIEQLLISSI